MFTALEQLCVFLTLIVVGVRAGQILAVEGVSAHRDPMSVRRHRRQCITLKPCQPEKKKRAGNVCQEQFACDF